MQRKSIVLSIVFLTLILSGLKAQTSNDEQEDGLDSLENKIEKSSRLTLGASYTNHVNYRGRDYGVNQSGYSPDITFNHSSGFHIGLGSSIWNQNGSFSYGMTQFSIGYEKEYIKNRKFTLN